MNTFISCNKGRYFNKGVNNNMAIVVDGIIGAGKTTVGRFLSKEFNLSFFEELKTEDQNSLAQRMLDKFYVDQSRWSAIIQIMFLNDRFRDIKHAESTFVSSIFDRSIYGDEIFAKTIHDRGEMTDDEFAIYKSVLSNFLEHISPPKLLIYIDVSVDTAMKRINKRARSTESDVIPRDYMEDLKRNYDLWVDNFNLCPKVIINLDEDMVDDDGNLSDKMKQLLIDKIKTNIE